MSFPTTQQPSMAVQQPNPPTYTVEEQNLMRLRFIHAKVSTSVLHYIFENGSTDRHHNVSLLDYYKDKGVVMTAFKKKLYAEQKDKIASDPKGNTFDVTLLFNCLRFGSHGLEKADHDKWKENNDSLESLITTLKNIRNKIAHEEPVISNQKLITETNDLRDLLKRILEFAEKQYATCLPINVKQKIDDMNARITKYLNDYFTPLDLEEYKKHVLFPAQSEFVNIEGKIEVKKEYDGRDDTVVTPVTHEKNIKFPVDEVFTEMKLRGESRVGQEIITYEGILEGEMQNPTDSVILIEGNAGVGKTTLTKKILKDWISDNTTMKHLDTYDILLYTQCRNNTIDSFTKLLQHLMPKVARNFKSADLEFVTLAQKILIIIDGLDEKNKSSERLFEEILWLKKASSITVLVTTRPEKLPYFDRFVNSLPLKTKHIELLGIPRESRDEFVRKYYNKMEKPDQNIPAIHDLLEYLKRTEYRLSHLWKLPYNLILLIIIWIIEFKDPREITTSAELYWEIHQLYLSKLKGRKLGEKGDFIKEALEKKIIVDFVRNLGKEALVCLVNDNINLTDESYKRLEDICSHNNVCPDEMIGAFLNNTITKNENRYTFPHKSLQEFYAALYMHNDIEDKSKADAASSSPATSKQVSTMVIDILKEIPGSVPLAIEKYQNLMLILIGLFHLKGGNIRESIKSEVLKILNETGIVDRDDWLKILDSVKCDEFVAKEINQQFNILGGDIYVEDSTIFAYISLLNAMQSPFENGPGMKIEIELRGDTSGLKGFLTQIKRHQLQVTRMTLHSEFRHATPSLSYRDALNKVYQRNEMKTFLGAIVPGLNLPKSVGELYVSIADASCYGPLESFFKSNLHVRELGLCVNPSIDSSKLSPLPGSYLPWLYVLDVQNDSDIQSASKIIKKLQPTDGKKKFYQILFPRCTLSPPAIRSVIQTLSGVRVYWSVVFPSSCRPSSDQEEEEIKELAQNELNSIEGVEWGVSDPIDFPIDNW